MIQSPTQRNIYYFSFYNGKLRRSNNPTKATNIFVNQVISNNKNSLQIYQQTIKGEKLEVWIEKSYNLQHFCNIAKKY